MTEHFCKRNSHPVFDKPKAPNVTPAYCGWCRMFLAGACAENGHQKVNGFCTFCGQYDGSLDFHLMDGSGTATQTLIMDAPIIYNVQELRQ